MGGSLLAVEDLPRVPVLEAGPKVDGVIDRSEWSGTLELAPFGQEATSTQAWISVAEGKIWMAIRCREPSPGQMKIRTIADEKKGAVWNDDSVELFLDVTNTGESIFHLVCNPEGTFYDSEIIHLQHTPAAWDSRAVVRSRVYADRWEVEAEIPMEGMGHRLERGEVIALNIGRNRHVRPGEPERSSLVGGKRFLEPERFARLLTGGPVDAEGVSFISTRRGPFYKGVPGVWEFTVPGAQVRLDKLLTFPNARQQPEISRKGNVYTVSFPAEESKRYTQCRVRLKKETLYESTYRLRNSRFSPQRVAVTKEPVFEPLLEPRPEGLSRHGVIVWPHEIDRLERQRMAVRTGEPYHPDDPYRQYAADGAILIFQTRTLRKKPAVLEKTREYNIPVMIWLTPRGAVAKGVPVVGMGKGNYPGWQLDPRSVEAYLEDAREAIALSREFPNIRWLHSGDETWESMHRRLLHFLDHREGYPEFAAADREVREKYGFGKYGFPESSRDANPFRWIATSRWEIASMLAVEKRVKELISTEAPQLKFVSWDSMDGHHPYGLRRWGEVFDVITGQLYPSRDASREDFAFHTQLYADLSGAKEIWPVPHVESYAARFTPEETEELLSQTFRGGATGLHLYLADTLGERAGKANPVVDRIGSPERWNVISSITRRLREAPFRVRQPVADTAIFYSNTSYQGQDGHAVKRRHTGEVEWAYNLLGPGLRSALRFVDDLLCQEAPGELGRYKVIYIPYAPIADDAEVAALQSYVEAGGRLVVCDPLAFRHRSDGTARVEGALLPPLAASEPLLRDAGQWSAGESVLAPISPAYPLVPGEDAALLRHADGAPAAIERSLGKGSVLFFGGNPLLPGIASNEEWLAFFKGLQQKAGAELEQAVWRFRFPRTPPLAPAEYPGRRCLTGNAVEWSMSVPRLVAGAAVLGSYRLSRPDDRHAEAAGVEIPFSQGRLTDRFKGARAATQSEPGRYVLSWSMAEPLEIDYRFEAPVQLDAARLLFSGALPPGGCEVSADGKEWHEIGRWGGRVAAAPEAVEAHLLKLGEPRTVRHLRFRFDSAVQAAPFTFVETDLWGDEV